MSSNTKFSFFDGSVRAIPSHAFTREEYERMMKSSSAPRRAVMHGAGGKVGLKPQAK